MPNIKSAKKRVLVSNKNRIANNNYKAPMRTAIKKFERAVQNKDKDVNALFIDAVKLIDKACSKGVIKKNTAARYKSNLSKKINESK